MVARRVAFVAAFLVLCAVVSTTAGGGVSYSLRVALDPVAGTLTGTERVELVNDTGTPLSEVRFLLLANWGAEPNPFLAPSLEDPAYVAGFDPTWTLVHSVSDAGERPLAFRFEAGPPALQTYSLSNAYLIVTLARQLPAGASTTLNVAFTTKFSRSLRGDQSVYRDVFIWRFGWNPIVVPAAPGDRFALPAAQYELEIRVPEEYAVFCGADRQVTLSSGDGWTSVAAASDRPVRSVPLVLGKGLFSTTLDRGATRIEAVYGRGGEASARLSLLYAADILDAYRERFGTTAPRRVLLVENPAPGLFGMAADGLVLIGADVGRMKDMPALGTADRLIEYLLAHELAHLIWGIGVGADFNAENWISEGLAEYAAVSLFEDRHGAFGPNVFGHLGAGFVEDVLRDLVGHVNLRRDAQEYPYIELLRFGFDEGIVKPLSDVEYLNGLTVRTYNKGYLVLRALESLVGRETLQGVLAAAAMNYTGRTLSVADLRGMLAAAAGPKLPASFFADWLYGDATVDYAVLGVSYGRRWDAHTATLELRAAGSLLPVTVEATLADGSTVRVIWTPTKASETLTLFEAHSPVTRIAIDPDEMLPDRNRFDNHWPRRLRIDHPFRGPDAVPVGRPLDAYAIRLSLAGVSGGFRRDHSWSVALLPHLGDEPPLSFAEAFSTFDLIGAFVAEPGRHLSFASSVAIERFDPSQWTGDLDLRVATTARFFTHPETGAAGQYWVPTHALTIAFGARGDLAGPVPFVTSAYAWTGFPTTALDAVASLTLGIPGFGVSPFAAAELRASGRVRLAPLVYLDVAGSAAWTFIGRLPEEFTVSLRQLRAFDAPSTGQRQVFGELTLVLPPLVRHAGYALLSLARVDTVTAMGFARGGQTVDPSALAKREFHAEAGAVLDVRLTGPLGVSFHIGIGYAAPLVGSGGSPRPFVEFGL